MKNSSYILYDITSFWYWVTLINRLLIEYTMTQTSLDTFRYVKLKKISTNDVLWVQFLDRGTQVRFDPRQMLGRYWVGDFGSEHLVNEFGSTVDAYVSIGRMKNTRFGRHPNQVNVVVQNDSNTFAAIYDLKHVQFTSLKKTSTSALKNTLHPLKESPVLRLEDNVDLIESNRLLRSKDFIGIRHAIQQMKNDGLELQEVYLAGRALLSKANMDTTLGKRVYDDVTIIGIIDGASRSLLFTQDMGLYVGKQREDVVLGNQHYREGVVADTSYNHILNPLYSFSFIPKNKLINNPIVAKPKPLNVYLTTMSEFTNASIGVGKL